MNSVLGFFRRLSIAGGRQDEGRKKAVGERRGTGEQWSCQTCTLLNPSELEKCSACNTQRPVDLEANRESTAGHLDSHNPLSPLHHSDEYAPARSHQVHPQRRLSDSQIFTPHSHSNHFSNDRGFPTPEDQWQDPTLEDNFISLPAMAVTPSPDVDNRGPVSLVTSQGTPTWQCNICGAYNVVMRTLRQCYICGIGVIPECYLPSSPTGGAGDVTRASRGVQETAFPPRNHRGLQEERPRNGGSGESDPLEKRSEHMRSSDCQGHKQKHSLTHHNDLGFPETNACSNMGDLPPLERQPEVQHVNGSCAMEPSQDNIKANNRVSPPQSKQQKHVHPWTPTSPKKVQAPAERQKPHHQRQHSDEGARVHWLEESIQFNRTKCLNEIRYEDVLMANTVYQGIQQYCKEHGEPFTDPDFPPATKSLYIDPKKPVSRWKVCKWERPLQVRDTFDSGNIQWTVVRNPRPEDIAQGVLGNCWVLSALGVVAEQPQLIEDIILTKKFSPKVGAYQIRLCKDGCWQVVVVDDCLPCLKNRELVFSKAHRKQLWVPLIEKALAKLYGSYEALNAGRVLLGLSVLTGLPCEKIHIKKPSPKDDDIDHDLVWARLLSFREHGFPMSASCGGEDDEGGYANKGLESNHAYSILDIRQIGSERLVRLRNPWGKYSWKGSWSDQDPRWRSQPWLRDELQAVGNEAGVFWMGAQDFFKYFCEVDVCKYRPNWHSVRSEGKLHPFAASRIKTLAFEVYSTTEVDISIYQPTSRGRPRHHSLVDMAVLVLRYPSTHQLGLDSHSSLPIACTLESGSSIQSIITTNGFLAPGSYVILPLAFNHYQHLLGTDRGRERERERERGKFGVQEEREDDAIPYVVAVFSARELAYESVVTRPGFLSESLFLLAEKTGKVSQPFPSMVLYEVYLKHACRILVAVNYDHLFHFTVTCDGVDSVNILSSRGDMFTQDCIPPRHRQVLVVLTQMEHSVRYCVLMKISFGCTEVNSQGQWGAEHIPELTSTNAELHSPRLIS